MQVTAQMLRDAFRQTQREILDPERPARFEARFERMAELMNEKLAVEYLQTPSKLSVAEQMVTTLTEQLRQAHIVIAALNEQLALKS